MTAPARPRDARVARVLDGTRSTALFAIGLLWDIVGIVNVPGAAEIHWGADARVEATDLGVVLALAVLAAWGTVFVRARTPIPVLIAGGVLLVIGVSYLLALVGVFHALQRWPRRTWQISAAAAVAVTLFVIRETTTDWGTALLWLFDSRGTDPDGVGWVLAPWIIALIALGGVAGAVAYQRTRHEAEASKRRAEREHARADALDEQLARQAERERIARDLHDGLGHRLSTAALSASAFEAQVAADPAVNPALAAWAGTMRQQLHAALEDVRGIVGGLRTDPRPASGASPSLRDIAALLADHRSAGHRVDAYVVIEAADGAAPAMHSEAYRIVQEALTNAIKHAPGHPVSLLVDAAPERGLRIRVENPVGPHAGSSSGGYGILGIRERVDALGGEAWIGPHDGRFIVDVTLPWTVASPRAAAL